ncbi:alpha-ketoglutarate-dependent dioxygenase alkB homolog 4 [Toxorhynchites rutilus septentrionalis]|uniref:alpha-ketoglutarate-dependent dioxygenase alkB homolog 4 n=1 Tax=Toxorhynchites rutilus septentrionalis TaxID=329112 RepID=UPI002478FEFC|nr:alpha-ketoglutarate-dependent dioxygenase alkB homolog 4 [Toxorhynchites rutilus septentrionalis]
MDHPRPCGCKGRRTCLICEKDFNLERHQSSGLLESGKVYSFCPHCNKIYTGWNTDDVISEHSHNHGGQVGEDYPGVYIDLNFLSEQEERKLMQGIDEMKWDISQSGRRKQNFGPKTNFKKTKIRVGDFGGFPKFSEFVQDKFKQVPLMEGFQTIEQCSLEYTPERGASIDPHIDDCWVWGERIVTVNLLSDSVLTMSKYQCDDGKKRYNLDFVDKYRDKLIMNLPEEPTMDKFDDRIVRIPMPRRSLLIIYGSPRYQWEHSVLREDITERRVCLAYREFTPLYLKDGSDYEKGEEILRLAQRFWNHIEIPT